MMRKCLSRQFNLDIFQGIYFPKSVPITALEHIYASKNIEAAIENCLDCIKDDGGLLVVIWYSRGEINDKSLIGMSTQSDEGQVDLVG